MATLATAELSCPAQVLDVEVKRRGKSYTADTLRTLRRQYPEDELWLLMGTDLIDKVSPKYPLTEDLLHQIAFGPDKQRYEFSEDGKRVHAVETFPSYATKWLNPMVAIKCSAMFH